MYKAIWRPLAFTTAFFLVGCRTSRSIEERALTARELLRQERFSEELPIADEGLHDAERTGNLELIWRFRLLRGDGLMGRRALQEVLQSLKKYGEPPAGARWDATRAHFFLLQGQACYFLSRFEQAGPLLSKAREAATQANSPELLAEVDLREGAMMGMNRNFEGAKQACERVLQTATKEHNRNLEARAATNYGFALLSESRYDEAIPWFQRAEKTALEIRAGDSAARAEGNIGACYARLGDYDAARLSYEKARTRFDAVKNDYELQAWTGNEGNLYYETGDMTEAAAYYQRALALARKIDNPSWKSRWLLNLASTSIELEDWKAADGYNKEGLDLNRIAKDAVYEPLSNNDAARIAAGRGHLDEAESGFRAALTGKSEDPTVELEAHTGLAGLYLRNGKPREADVEFRLAIAIIDGRQSQLLKDEYKLSWLASLIRFYRQYADFLVAQGETDKALYVAESSRSKVLSGNSGSAAALHPASTAEYKQLSRSSHATLIEYFFGTVGTYLWVTTPDGVQFHSLSTRSAIRALVSRYRALIAAGRNPLEIDDSTGAKLYDLLVAPARADAGSSNRFIIVADDELHSLNFETLPDGDKSGRFWIESATIRIAPSLNYLAARTAAVPQNGGSKMLLIGNAVPSGMFPKLEFAGQEIDEIVHTSGYVPEVRTGAAATPAAYKEGHAGDFGYIHFAAHALMNSMKPLDSAVILSGPPDKGRLLASDVVSIPLKADLVTVSACRGAGSKSYAGEGLVGFAWAFLKAGASNVIAGLWDVNDKSTTQIMTGLYRRIGAGEAAPDALRESKLALIRQGGAYAKPFYWAPFQLYTGRP